ncbi:MAG: hypothetical protein V2A78_05480 [bacterium]
MKITLFVLLSLLMVYSPVCAEDRSPVARQEEVAPQGEYAKIDTSGIIRDMKILDGGDKAAREALIKKIKKAPGDYAPPVFISMAQCLYEKQDYEGAYFWFCFGRLRGRYDAARCADVSAREGIDAMIINVNPELRKYPATLKNPDDIVTLAKRIVRLDEAMPYRYDHRWLNLHGMGAFIGGKQPLSLPESEWTAMAGEVRKDFLKGAEELAVALKKKKMKEPSPTPVQTLEQRLRDFALDPNEVKSFLDLIKRCLTADDKQKFSSLMDFPITIMLYGKRVKIKNKGEFVKNYNEIINAKVRKSVSRQKYEDLFINCQGVMIGNGEIWFNSIVENPKTNQKTELKIIAINN